MTGWGFWLAILGMALTLAGFIVTWLQLKKTRGAADAAAAEISRIQLAISSYDAVQEISKAATAIDAVRRHLKNNAWSDVADSYDQFRRSINSVSRYQSLENQLQTLVVEADKYIIRLCERIESGLASGTIKIDPAKTKSVIRQHDELAAQIQISIQRNVVQ